MKLQESLDQVEGHLKTLDDQKFDQLSFEWEGIKFKATAEESRDGGCFVRLTANMGRLFYTIENSEYRSMAIERLYANNRSVDGAYSVDQQGNVIFRSLTSTHHKLAGKELMVALTTIVLQSETHLRSVKAHLKSHLAAA